MTNTPTTSRRRSRTARAHIIAAACRLESLEARTLLAASPFPGPAPASIPGTIQAESFDKGGEGVGYHDLTAANTGGQYRTADRVDIEKSGDTGAGYDVGWNQPGEWLGYTANAPSSGNYDLDIRAAYGGANASGGTVHLEAGGVDVTGPITLPKTGGWQTWQTVTRRNVSLAAGTLTLKLVMDKDGAGSTASTAYLANVNWIKLSQAGQTPYPGPAPVVPGANIEAENFDNGGEGLAYHDVSAGNTGGQYRTTQRVDIEKCGEGGFDVGWNQPSEWLAYTASVTSSGTYDLNIRAAYGGANANGGTVHLESDGANVSGPVTLPNTGGWQKWQTVTATGVSLTAGQHVLKLVMEKDGAGSTANTAYLANVNWISVTAPLAQGPTGHLDDPKNGGFIDAVALNTRGWIDITYSSPNPLDTSSITDEGPEFTLTGSVGYALEVSRVPTLVSGSTYRYDFYSSDLSGDGWESPMFTPGVAYVNFIAGSVADIYGNTNPADTKSFTVAGPYPGPDPAQAPGTIQAENFNTGGEGVAYHDTTVANEGGQYRPERVDVEKSADTGGGYDVGWVRAGEWLAYTVDVGSEGTRAYDFAARVASKGPGGKFHLALDGQKLAGSDLTIPNTGGWQAWTTITAPGILLPAGRHSLSLVFDANGANDTGGGPSVGNVNWFQINVPQVKPGSPGSPDPSFGINGIATSSFTGTPEAMAIAPDGKVVVATSTSLVRFTANGQVDTTFGSGGRVMTDFGVAGLAITANGYIVVGGTVNDSIALAEYTPAGALYSGFGTGGKVVMHDNTYPGGQDQVSGIGIDGQGRILVADDEEPFDAGDGFATFYTVVVRFSPTTGERIDHIVAGYQEDFFTATSAQDGSVVFGGTDWGVYGIVTRVDSSGVVSGSKSMSNGGNIWHVACGGGRIYAAGSAFDGHPPYILCLDGNLRPVTGFGLDLLREAGPMAAQADGKLLLYDGGLCRFNLDGTIDLTFGAGGAATVAFGLPVVAPDGKIYTTGVQNGTIAVGRLLGDAP